LAHLDRAVKGALGAVVGAINRALVALLVAPVRGYQVFLSPLFGGRCRYVPSCSQYAIEALRVHGAVRGSALAAWRVLRCHPWGGHGYDPVPPRRAKG
jgi:putative membrane protein insertion efficiency factor